MLGNSIMLDRMKRAFDVTAINPGTGRVVEFTVLTETIAAARQIAEDRGLHQPIVRLAALPRIGDKIGRFQERPVVD